jgi:tetratricopeptide (TPR) repeat protein
LCCGRLGDLLYVTGRAGEAEEPYREAIAVHKQSGTEGRFPVLAENDLYEAARAAVHLALALLEADKPEASQAALKEAIDLLQQSAQQGKVMALARRSVEARIHRIAGDLYWAAGDKPKARERYRRALGLHQGLMADDSAGKQAYWRWHFAWFLATCPDPELRDLRHALALGEQAYRIEPTCESAFVLGLVQCRHGQWQKAVGRRIADKGARAARGHRYLEYRRQRLGGG